MKLFNNKLYGFLLSPIAFLFSVIAVCRRFFLEKLVQPQTRLTIPLIIIGNLTVGGSGKTPLSIALAVYLKKRGFSPGIVSRGYGGRGAIYPCLVSKNSSPRRVGDEPLMIFRRTNVPIVVDPNRVNAIKQLLHVSDCDVILSDDGLQHYAMPRYIEIVVVSDDQRFGNNFCLPAGPLREPLSRLFEVDYIVLNGKDKSFLPHALHDKIYEMELISEYFINLKTKNSIDINAFVLWAKGKVIHACAGIGYPPRFFKSLKNLGLEIIEHSFADHYLFKANDFNFSKDELIIFTEKDAVKCRSFATDSMWYLKIDARLPDVFFDKILQDIDGFI